MNQIDFKKKKKICFDLLFHLMHLCKGVGVERIIQAFFWPQNREPKSQRHISEISPSFNNLSETFKTHS